MPTLTKDAITTGFYRKGERVVPLDRDNFAGWKVSSKTLRDNGYMSPLWFEHPPVLTGDQINPEAFPVHKDDEETIRRFEADPHFAGWLEDVRLWDSEDGTSKVDFDLNVPDEALTHRLSTTGTFISPQFGKFKPLTGPLAGQTLDNVVSHVALTKRPVNKTQSSRFLRKTDDTLLPASGEGPPVQLSTLSEVLDHDVVRFSMADLLEVEQFNDPAGNPNASQGMQTPQGQDRMTQPQQTPMPVPGNDKPDMFKQFKGMLKGMLKMLESVEGEMDADDESEDAETSGGVVSKNSNEELVVSMSDEQTLQQQIDELKTQVTQFSQQNQRLIADRTSFERQQMLSDVESCVSTGRMSTADAEQIRTLIEQHQFSAESDEPTLLQQRIAMHKQLKRGAYWSPDQILKDQTQFAGVQREGGTEDDPFFNSPNTPISEPSDDRAAEIMAEMYPVSN